MTLTAVGRRYVRVIKIRQLVVVQGHETLTASARLRSA